jgi:alkylation response protein AidB-like acyl-CoA dehydrogenase
MAGPVSLDERQFRDAAGAALGRLDTLGAARRGLDGHPGVDQWTTVKAAGWPGLLLPESRGGADLGIAEALLVSEECGRRLGGGGLIGHLAATSVVDAAAADGNVAAAGVLPDLASGARRGAMVFAEPPGRRNVWTVGRGSGLPRVDANGRVTGSAQHQLDVLGTDLVVVPALSDGDDVVCCLIDTDAAGCEIVAHPAFDASRPLAEITLRGATGTVLPTGGAPVEHAWHLGQALLAADALGATSALLASSIEYSKQRSAFGRLIGSYQAVRHQIVEMFRHAETVRNLCLFAALAADSHDGQFGLAANAARVAGDAALDYTAHTAIAVHGGIGATWEHDAHLFWRRGQVGRLLLGGTRAAESYVAADVLARARGIRDTDHSNVLNG